jgi:hypothetical protein
VADLLGFPPATFWNAPVQPQPAANAIGEGVHDSFAKAMN